MPNMAEGVGVSDEQLDEWGGLASMMSVSAVYEIAVTGSGAIQALIGEVRASHAREAELRQQLEDARSDGWDSGYDAGYSSGYEDGQDND